MAQTPGWLVVTVRLNNRPASYFANKLFSKIVGTSAIGTLLGGKFALRKVAAVLDSLITGIVTGVYEGNFWLAAYADPAAGSYPAGSITVTSVAGVAAQVVTFTFGTLVVTITEAGASAAGAEQYNRDTVTNTVTGTALSLSNKLSAHPLLSGLFTFTPTAGAIAIKSKIPGLLLQNVAIAASGTTVVQLTGGAVGVATVFPQHVLANRNP